MDNKLDKSIILAFDIIDLISLLNQLLSINSKYLLSFFPFLSPLITTLELVILYSANLFLALFYLVSLFRL
jgi:hypothetical protein